MKPTRKTTKAPATGFATPQAAEAAFYAAIEQCDYQAMVLVWAHDDDAICIHPGAPRLEGWEDIADSWQQIFATAPMLKFDLSEEVYTQTDSLSIHQVRENVLVDGEASGSVVSTNIYRLIEGSWHMVLHHASPEPEPGELLDYGDEPVLH